jgi:hypothetical protein
VVLLISVPFPVGFVFHPKPILDLLVIFTVFIFRNLRLSFCLFSGQAQGGSVTLLPGCVPCDASQYRQNT